MAPGPADTLEVLGVETTVRRAGSGRSVLYLHGAFYPTRWTGFHDAMSAEWDLTAPLHPGYAEGEPPDWLRGFDDLSLHYRGLLDALDARAIDLVGYGIGAWIGANLAAFYPDRIRSLAAIAPMGLWVPEAPMFEFLACGPDRRHAALFNGADTVAGLPEQDPDDIAAFVEGYGEDGVTARLIWERRYDIRLVRRLSLLTMPALVVAAADDRVVPLEHAERWAHALPDARLVTIAGTGHGLVFQSPELVVNELRTFYGEVPA